MRGITKNHSEEFKREIVKKILLSGRSLREVSKETGISTSTIFVWKKKYAMNVSMKKNSISHWTPEQILEAIIQTSSMTEQDLGEYLRINGLHSCDLENFKKDFLNSYQSQKPQGRGRPKLDPEVAELRKQEKQLKRDLRKTQSALAEQTARIILLKKSHEIWGTSEEDE
jgi:transposase-like protein